ncbi:hypothetical protein EVAR_52864_1 [Eumeta japonica]|uniref:Uncharacterized protein n=1 Tax=Eumeta variegata TaxID=151549 RepID=A0A4C1YM79_EUMVA|nr:hypothetical protein EVAR_52864_1 [Eumeta japonica]
MSGSLHTRVCVDNENIKSNIRVGGRTYTPRRRPPPNVRGCKRIPRRIFRNIIEPRLRSAAGIELRTASRVECPYRFVYKEKNKSNRSPVMEIGLYDCTLLYYMAETPAAIGEAGRAGNAGHFTLHRPPPGDRGANTITPDAPLSHLGVLPRLRGSRGGVMKREQ